MARTTVVGSVCACTSFDVRRGTVTNSLQVMRHKAVRTSVARHLHGVKSMMSPTWSAANLNIDPSWPKHIMTIRQTQLKFVSTLGGVRRPAASRLYDLWHRPPSFRFRRFPGRSTDRRATAALEFAVATPLLIVMLGGAADYGLSQCERVMLANAVAAGAQYATFTGAGVSTGGITSVIQKTSNLPNATTSVTVTFSGLSPGVPSPGWYCISGPAPTVSGAACTNGTCSPCSDGSMPGYYISFRASYTNTGLMNGFMSAASQTMAEQATVRLQ
jgi:hypothetical protein